MKKDKGGIDGMFFSLATTMVVFILLYTMIPFFSMIHARQEINAVARPYLLKMETIGYISSEDAVLLKQEIMARIDGATKVEILPETNLTESKDAAYGTKVVLAFDVTFETFGLNLTSIFTPTSEKETYVFAYNEATIAKGG